MTIRKKLIVFMLFYALLGIVGMLCSGGVLHLRRQFMPHTATEVNITGKLMLVDQTDLDEAVMMVCPDQNNTFYQYPIVKNISSYRTASDIPENMTRLKLAKHSHRIHHRKNSCILKMSVIVEDKENLPVITDSLGSEFRLKTKESETGQTILYILKIFKGDIPENYVLWIDDQEIIFH